MSLNADQITFYEGKRLVTAFNYHPRPIGLNATPVT
jgi:hypothetical protein